ncbi:osmotically inducible protein OsmC [Kitasatospora sp. MAP12-15]|uniref:OsmC family peroxiredoxin n=1 Tax=unclassified Kitasatospora TaxID=2633591 RepID=UPI002473DD98|nr:OsmC family peroxiredoxin [Kitasatospora sp. MAP12-44]MDH6115570.1 osmotically inducible protein OsmC [Kitasatospora sp. MAP12-44]
MPVSQAHAAWHGDIPTGSGEFTAGGSVTGGVTYKSRFEGGPGSNPEQLIAAAHASCFSMALAGALADAGFPAESIETDASVTLRPVDGIPTITRIELVTSGRVSGLDGDKFRQFADAAKANCPVSRALAGVPDVTLQATLSDG